MPCAGLTGALCGATEMEEVQRDMLSLSTISWPRLVSLLPAQLLSWRTFLKATEEPYKGHVSGTLLVWA